MRDFGRKGKVNRYLCIASLLLHWSSFTLADEAQNPCSKAAVKKIPVKVSEFVKISAERPSPEKFGPYYEIQRPLLIYLSQLKAANFTRGDARATNPMLLLVSLLESDSSTRIVEFGSGDGHAVEQLFMSEPEFYAAHKSYLAAIDAHNAKTQNKTSKRKVMPLIRHYVEAYGPSGKKNKAANDPIDPWLERVLQYVRRPLRDKPRVTAITYDMHRSQPQIPNLTFKVGTFFEDMRFSEEIGAFDIGIDMIGVFGYTGDIAGYLMKTLSNLTIDGNHFVHDYGNTKIIYLDEQSKRQRIDFGQWLKRRSKGLNVAYPDIPRFGGDVSGIRKVSAVVEFPELAQDLFIDGRPPKRDYIETGRTIRLLPDQWVEIKDARGQTVERFKLP